MSGRIARRPPGPDFIVIGFSKCGSTSLCAMLAEHPEIGMSTPKETNFYLWEHHRGQAWYEACFAGSRPGQLRGEGSVFYSATEWEGLAGPRIVAANPRVKLVWIARHPLERLESSYREAHHSGHLFRYHAPYSIGEYLADAPVAVADTRYRRRLDRYLALVPAEQCFVLFLEDLIREPARELARLHAFLGVRPWPAADRGPNQWLNRGGEKLYDSRLLRLARRTPGLERLVRKAGGDRIDRLGRRIGLRRRFAGPIRWRPGERDRVLDELRDDATGLLRFAGKPADFWDLGSPQADAVVRHGGRRAG